MAALALGMVGGFFGGPLGFLVGNLIGNLLFPQKGPGPMSNLSLSTSQYGQMIPICYGNIRVAGNLIWQTDLQPHAQSSGKGGGAPTSYTYSASFAIQLCEGPISGVINIWADGTLIWSINGTNNGSSWGPMPCLLYLGDEVQGADPTMEAVLGVGFVPGYRGTAYVVFDQWDLTNYGNRIPVLNFEVQVKGGGESPMAIVAQYLDEPPTGDGIDRWAFVANGGRIGAFFPYITKWDLTGADIRIKPVPAFLMDSSVEPTSYNSGTVYTYSNPSLISDGSDFADDPVPWTTYSGFGSCYAPVGFYVYADGTSTPLWYFNSPEALTNGNTFQPMGADSATVLLDGDGPFTTNNFLYNAGLPTGLYVNGCTLSQDGTCLYVFTDSGVGGSVWMKHYYKIVDGAVIAQGTVTPNLSVGSIGFSQSGCLNDNFIVNMMENDYETIWVYDSNGGIVKKYRIANGNLALDTGAGTVTVGSPQYSRPGHVPATSGTFYPAIYVPASGYCGICVGTALFLISTQSFQAPTALSEIVSDLSVRAGLATAQINVTQLTPFVDGYVITNQQTVRDSITPLQSAWYFDAVESSAVVDFVMRGSDPILTIPDTDLAAVSTGAQPPALVTVVRAQEVDLPQLISVTYINAANDFQQGTQISQRQTVESQLQQTVQLSISLSDLKAKQVSNTLLFTAWIERMKFTFLTSRQYAYLEPTDVIMAHGYEIRIMQKSDVANDVIQFDGVASVSAVWTTSGPVAGTPAGFTPTTPPAFQQSALSLINIPMVTDNDYQDGLYGGMAGASAPAWPGGSLYQSLDGGSTYNVVESETQPTVMGTVTGLPLVAFGGGNMFDESSVFQVTIGAGGGTLSSQPESAVLNGANVCMCGPEMIQFKNATLISAGVYNLTGLLRGRRGTEWSLIQHVAGELFVLLPTAFDVNGTFAELGVPLYYKAVTSAGSLSAATPIPFVNTGQGALCYAPVQLGGGPDASGNVNLTWIRRTRIGGAWVNFTDVPLSEASEQYVVQILDSTYSNVARVVTVTSPTFEYTSAMQVTDFGQNQQTIFFSVGQVGAYALGTVGQGTAVGAGSSNTAVGTPAPPYNAPPGPAPGTGGGCPGTVIGPVVLGYVTGTELTQVLDPTTTWVVQFTTGSGSPTSLGVCNVWCDSGQVQSILSTLPCGAPLLGTEATSKFGQYNSHGFFITSNPNPSAFPTLSPSTVYIVTVVANTPGTTAHIDMNVPT